MIIQKSFSKYVVFCEDTLLSALNKMNANGMRVLFAVSEAGRLEGVLSDGDFRRWLTSTEIVDLNVMVSAVMNTDFKFAEVDTPSDQIAMLLDARVLAVPLVDRNKRLAAVALAQQEKIEIEGRLVAKDAPVFVIAEIGNNHNGDVNLALELVDLAADAGADCAKFQMRDLKQLYRNRGDANDDSSDLGTQYTMDLLARFQLTDDELFRVFDHCRRRGLTPLCTPWDGNSLSKLEGYGLPAYKLASADFTNHDLMTEVARTGKPIICSTGMATEAEILDGVRHLKSIGANYILLHCNSTYPAPFKDINLAYLASLRQTGDCLVGYSGHERDIFVPIAAVGLGAKVIEKHFTVDRTMEGNDHKVSLLPAEFARMVEGIRQVEQALGGVKKRELSQGEMMNRETLAKSLIARCDIPSGTTVTEDMIAVRSPGQGLQPNRRRDLVGTVLKASKQKDDFFFDTDLDDDVVRARNYELDLEWGVPVRYHDMQKMLSLSNMKMLEIHLSYKDMELAHDRYFDGSLDLGLVVHAPELFSGDHTLDLCSANESYRKRSLYELQRVIDLTNDLKKYFRRANRPCIVTNVGGWTLDGHIAADRRAILYDRLEDSLSKLNMEGIEIIAQTMPPFPWHFGGQQFHNLFVDAASTAQYCQRTGMRICLDVSHSKLACTHLKTSFSKFLTTIMPFAAHLHLADASGVDGEGLQIGDGEIDWENLFALYRIHCSAASFIPEIWQGHKNGGEGAWRAMERLEAKWKRTGEVKRGLSV